MGLIFLDSSMFIALADARDQNHPRARRLFGPPPRMSGPWVTSDYVFDEVITWLRKHAGHAAARTFGDRLLTSALFQLRRVQAEDFEQAWPLFGKSPEPVLSFTDCTTAALMKRLGIGTIATFDADFRRLGFVTVPAAGGD